MRHSRFMPFVKVTQKIGWQKFGAMNLHKQSGIFHTYSTSERELFHSCMLRSGAVACVQANFATQFTGGCFLVLLLFEKMCV